MAILRLNISRDGAITTVGAEGEENWRDELARRLDAAPDDAPVTALLHGFRYSWRRGDRACDGRNDPHRRLYTAWPAALGFTENDPANGLCIAIAWEARERGLSSFATVYRRAAETGRALARIADFIAGRNRGRTLSCFAHSLGARVVIAAMIRARPCAFGKTILLGPAADLDEAETALSAAGDAGGAARILHMDARANRVFDGLFNAFAPRPAGARPLGHEAPEDPRWIRVVLDDPNVREALAARGAPLSRGPRVMSHSCFYEDPALMALYRDLIRTRGAAPFARFRNLGNAVAAPFRANALDLSNA